MHLMGHHGVYLRDGWEHVLQYRPQSCPNESFKLQLAKLEVKSPYFPQEKFYLFLLEMELSRCPGRNLWRNFDGYYRRLPVELL